MSHNKLIGFTFLLLISCFQLLSAETIDSTSETSLEGTPKIYIDCRSCDNDYLRREITFATFVRDRNQADIHIIVSRQRTGSGGDEYMVEFIGQNDFEYMTDTLIFNTKEADTDDVIRKKTAQYFQLGLTRFVSKTSLSEHLTVSFSKPTKQVETVDKWKNWVFQINGNFWLNGDANYRSTGIFNKVEAQRITEELKVEFGVWWNYNEQKFTNDTGYDLFINRSKGTNANFVFSLNDQWSTAYEYNFFTSTFSNRDFDFSNEIGIEYNLYPYKESSRRSWILRLNLGGTYIDYTEKTIYNKTHEWLTYTRLRSSIDLTQPWGSIYSSLNGVVYFHDLATNKLTLSGGMSVNLFEGFSLNFNGNYSRVRDQISLSAAGSSDADILLRQSELASGYNYWFSFGMSYSFGSIYNNVVNPRF